MGDGEEREFVLGMHICFMMGIEDLTNDKLLKGTKDNCNASALFPGIRCL